MTSEARTEAVAAERSELLVEGPVIVEIVSLEAPAAIEESEEMPGPADDEFMETGVEKLPGDGTVLEALEPLAALQSQEPNTPVDLITFMEQPTSAGEPASMVVALEFEAPATVAPDVDESESTNRQTDGQVVDMGQFSRRQRAAFRLEQRAGRAA